MEGARDRERKKGNRVVSRFAFPLASAASKRTWCSSWSHLRTKQRKDWQRSPVAPLRCSFFVAPRHGTTSGNLYLAYTSTGRQKPWRTGVTLKTSEALAPAAQFLLLSLAIAHPSLARDATRCKNKMEGINYRKNYNEFARGNRFGVCRCNDQF